MYVKRAKVFLLRTTMCTALLPKDTTKIPSEGSLRKWVVSRTGHPVFCIISRRKRVLEHNVVHCKTYMHHFTSPFDRIVIFSYQIPLYFITFEDQNESYATNWMTVRIYRITIKYLTIFLILYMHMYIKMILAIKWPIVVTLFTMYL